MIVEIIYDYLQANKRLVVPNLGAFIVKQSAEGERKVLFSNLVKSDDGVLRALLIEKGVNELEAAGVIDRFVFEVNHRLDNGGVCALEGFGALKRGANGSMSFVENEGAHGDVLDGGFAERLAERNAARQQQAQQAAPKVEAKPEPVVEDDDDEEMSIEVIPQTPAQQPSSQSAKAQQRSIDDLYTNDNLTASTQKRPASYVKGLRYGKGGKIITGREYVINHKTSVGDIFIKIAIVAAVVAMLALAYGMWNDWRKGKFESEEATTVENLDTEAESKDEEGITNPDLEYIQK
ncbi:MAG: hypothetical protein IJ434_00195 [Alistipes sp.]|nr:hypothetical protein [Alistipes sp.]